jgi:hypothetical protein
VYRTIFPDESPTARKSPLGEYAREVTCVRDPLKVDLRVMEEPECS